MTVTAARRSPRARRCVGCATLIVAGVTAPLLCMAMPGGASSLETRAATIASSIEADQANLYQLGESYLEQSAILESARRSEGVAIAAVGADEHKITGLHLAVARSAVSVYVEAGSTSSAALFLTKGADVAATSDAYLDAASAQLTGEIASLANDEHHLGVLITTRNAQVQAAAGALKTLTVERTGALRALASERSTLASVRGELEILVERRAAAAAAAAAAARARAEGAAEAKAAAAAAAANTTLAPGTTGTGTATTGTGTATTGTGTATTGTGTATTGTGTATTGTSAGPPSFSAVLVGTSSPIPAGSLSAAFAGIRRCESSGDYSLDTGNGYYGAYQFSASTWVDLGGGGVASQASPAAQDAAAYRLYQSAGFSAWPECAAILGL